MSNTPNLGLPMLQAAQAQKHVTVNEGLTLLDGMVNLRLTDMGLTTPPVTAVDGECFGVPSGAVNEWAGQDGTIAVRTGGGWSFVVPQRGWRGWSVAHSATVTFDGAAWVTGAVTLSPFGAGMQVHALEFDHVLSAGATNVTAVAIPSHAMVFGVTARVVAPVTGGLTSWRLGVAGADNRYGSGLGLGLGSFSNGILGAPLTVYTPEPLLLSGEGGDFAGGTVRIAAHYATLSLPRI